MTLLILVIYALLPAGFAVMYLAGYVYSPAELLDPYNLSILAGAAAYVVFMSQFLLSARLRFLERRVPQDRLLALHGAAGMASFALVLFHFIIKFVMIVMNSGISFQTSLGSLALLGLVVLSPMAYLVLRGKGVKKGKSPPYARVKTAHNLFALAGLAAAVHVMLASTTWSFPLRLFTLIWAGLTLGVYVNHRIIRPGRRTELKLSAVTKLAPDVHRFEFEGSVSRSAGQFGYFSFEGDIPGTEEHPFTIASASGEPVNITVRSSGDFTAAMPGAPVGTAVRFDGPYGKFGPSRFAEGTPLIFLAAGIGITPFLSLASDSNIRSLYPITILWSIRSDDDKPAADELQRLADSGELKFRIRNSRSEGRIDDAFLDIDKSAVYFICGPGGFGKSMRSLLKKHGIKRQRIIEERFSW